MKNRFLFTLKSKKNKKREFTFGVSDMMRWTLIGCHYARFDWSTDSDPNPLKQFPNFKIHFFEKNIEKVQIKIFCFRTVIWH